MEKFGAYGYLRTPYEIVRGGGDGRGVATSLAPSALREAPKPWLADALPRRYQDGLGLPPTWVEGVLAPEAAPAVAPPFTAPRRRQRTYDTPQAGGCLCGAVRFAVNAGREPKLVVSCFCRYCQKSSGAAHLQWATIDADDYTLLQGAPAEYAQAGGTRRFCGACGTPLSFARADLPDELDVALSSFDDPRLWDVEMSIWVDHRVRALRMRAALRCAAGRGMCARVVSRAHCMRQRALASACTLRARAHTALCHALRCIAPTHVCARVLTAPRVRASLSPLCALRSLLLGAAAGAGEAAVLEGGPGATAAPRAAGAVRHALAADADHARLCGCGGHGAACVFIVRA